MINSLRSRRLELGMTQAQVAKVIGYNKGTYANIESGKRSPSLKVAQLISNALGSTIDEIFNTSSQNHVRRNVTASPPVATEGKAF